MTQNFGLMMPERLNEIPLHFADFRHFPRIAAAILVSSLKVSIESYRFIDSRVGMSLHAARATVPEWFRPMVSALRLYCHFGRRDDGLREISLIQ